MSDAPFDPDAFVAAEKDNLDALLVRLRVGAAEIAIHASKALELGAAIAADRLAGKDTTVAERSLLAVYANLKSAATTEAAAAIAGYIESALMRGAKAAGTILLGLL